MDDSCGKCSAPLGQRARVCLQCGATRVPSVAVDAVQDAPIEVGGTVEEIETTSPVEAALPVAPSEEMAKPSPLKVEASVGPETIATEAVSVEVADSPHQEPRSGVPVSLVVILVLIAARSSGKSSYLPTKWRWCITSQCNLRRLVDWARSDQRSERAVW